MVEFAAFTALLVARVRDMTSCPVCNSTRFQMEEKPTDRCLIEASFHCGAVVWVADRNGLEARTGCPDALTRCLDEIAEEIEEEADA